MFISNIDKAKVLIQALPYIQEYYGKTIVVKYGGNAMTNEGLKDAVISDLVLLKLVGINVVLVHGGGPEISGMFDKLGIETQFINGLRYTSEEAVEVVQMVLAGKTNKDLVNRIEAIGGRAIGLSGIDGGLIKAKKLNDGEFDYCIARTTTSYAFALAVKEVNRVSPSNLFSKALKGLVVYGGEIIRPKEIAIIKFSPGAEG